MHELFRQYADKAHYDTKPKVQQAMIAAKVNTETQLYVKDSIRPEPVTDAQVKARYDEFIAKLKAGSAFDVIARQYSEAPNMSMAL